VKSKALKLKNVETIFLRGSVIRLQAEKLESTEYTKTISDVLKQRIFLKHFLETIMETYYILALQVHQKH